MSADRDHTAEPAEVQCHNLEKEEEADPDLESACRKEAERGHARAKGLMHHVHGQKAKIQKAKIKKAKITRAKAKAKIPRAKIGKVKIKVQKGNLCKRHETSRIFPMRL